MHIFYFDRPRVSACAASTRHLLYILRPFWIVPHHLLLQPSSPCHCGRDISTFFNGSATSTTIITYCRVRGVIALYSRPFCERALVSERAKAVRTIKWPNWRTNSEFPSQSINLLNHSRSSRNGILVSLRQLFCVLGRRPTRETPRQKLSNEKGIPSPRS